MSNDTALHALALTLDGRGITAEAVCRSEPAADCHWFSGIDCWCEQFDEIKTDQFGRYHTVAGFDGLLDRHDMRNRPSDCNVCDWLNADPDVLPELGPTEPFEVVRVDVNTWHEPGADGLRWRLDESGDHQVQLRHHDGYFDLTMVCPTGGDCSRCATGDPSILVEQYEGPHSQTAEIRVSPVWTGDEYDWKPIPTGKDAP